MRVLLLVNTTASSVTARTRVVIQKALGADHDLEVQTTVRRGHAARLARDAARRGVDVVAVLGGDGTLNEAADGLLHTSTALAALPGGSTNVYARTLGIPDDPVDATAQLLGALERHAWRRIGVGTVDERPFLFHCGVGYDAAVVESVEKRSAFKRYAAHPLFVIAAFDTWLRTYDHSHRRFDVEIGASTGRARGAGESRPHVAPAATEADEVDEVDEAAVTAQVETIDGATLMVVSKTSPYTFLGHTPLVIAPAAGLDSPLSVTVVRARRAVTILQIAAATFSSPALLHRHPAVTHRDGVTWLRVTATGRDVPAQADGDYLGDRPQWTFRYEPHSLTVVTP